MGSKTTVTPAAPTAEETALQQKQLELATFQLTELQKQSELQAQFAGDIGPLLEQQAADAELARERSDALFPIQEELLQLALEDIRRGGAATPEQIELIQQAGDAALERGGVDIERFRTEGLEALREELAPSLGLRPSDTPILDRGARVAAEATRQGGQLAAGIREAGLTAQLSLPLAQSQLLQQATLGQGRLQEATRQFQEGLRQAAFINRLNLQSSVGGLGLGLATGVNVGGFPGFQRGQTTTTSGFGLGGIGSLLSGAGSLIGGLGAAGAFGGGAAAASSFAAPVLAAAPFFGIASSRDLKTDKTPIDEDKVLEKVEKLPVEAWRYKPGLGLGDEPHVGTYAESFRESFGLGDGKTLNLMDTTGVLMASVKSLSKKVKKLEGLGLTIAPEGLGLKLEKVEAVGIPGLREAAHDGGRVSLGLAEAA
ncbi:MAG: hypothetical protein IIA72_03920 [Proteobacteria bacterium]|nr:hypothetical protein [Pseudomonadota bacterium]